MSAKHAWTRVVTTSLPARSTRLAGEVSSGVKLLWKTNDAVWDDTADTLQDIKTVGHNRNGFDSVVETDVLRSLYLVGGAVLFGLGSGFTSSSDSLMSGAPSYLKQGSETTNITGTQKDYGSEQTYDKNTNTIQYTTVAKFPPSVSSPMPSASASSVSSPIPRHCMLQAHAARVVHAVHSLTIAVTGGAGFVGSHLVDRLMLLGHEVTVLDNFFTGSRTTVSHWVGHPNFEMVRHDVVEPFLIEVDQIYHLACPASPPHYQYNAVKTIKTSFMGTLNMLGLAKRTKARFLITSTSEVYGDPRSTPSARTTGDTSTALAPDGVDVRVARIFNTFGPRMNPYDGRVVSNFIIQALKGEDMTVYGDGKQTRSFQYIHDLVDGLILLMNGPETRPVNIGSAHEFTILDFAEAVRDIVEKVQKEEGNPLAKRVNLIHKDMPVDDPQRRRADTSRAKETLGWEPKWELWQGVEEMVRYYSAKMKEGAI
ncbi:UDP-glucuronic acid decarboxylase 1 [Saitozyma podzolica]|uniref:UDP-glucuronic acid decarboxylase 1 n=1 Tax=Saitozyma podzolica TaxID=1890683 RepID=A0A427YCD9_9TREE|nr:UDP-glucuronic acid decarboxylase 1 [Saitozyma podzolica]